MKLVIAYSGEYTEEIEGIAKELGGTFSTKQLEAGKDILSIRVKDDEEFSFKAPLREYADVPIGFNDGLLRNLEVKWGKELRVTGGEEIVATISSEEDLDILRWTLWCYLEGLVDKRIGRLWL